jgi:hypothetical protein
LGYYFYLSVFLLFLCVLLRQKAVSGLMVETTAKKIGSMTLEGCYFVNTGSVPNLSE